MNVRLLGVVAAMSAMGLVACGDDTGGAGGAGGGGTGGDAAATTTATTGSTPTAAGTGGGDAATTTAGTGGGDTGTGGGGTGGEAPELLPCEEACADDLGCDESPANPEDGGDCATCVQAEGDAQSDCAFTGALAPCCQENDDCAAYIECVLGGSDTCGDDNPVGASRAAECVLESCGACGTPE